MWLMYAISAAIIWGLDYSVGERVLQQKISPMTLLLLQTLVGGVLLLLFGGYFTNIKKELIIITESRSLMWLTFWAIATFTLANLLIFLSIKAKNAALAGLVELTYPIFTILFSWLLFNQNRFSLSFVVGGFLIMTGVFIIGYFN